MQMSQDNHNLKDGDLAAMRNGQVKKSIDWTSLETDIVPHQRREGPMSPRGADEHAGRDRVSPQPDAKPLLVARDGSLRHLQQPRTPTAFNSPAQTAGINPAIPAHGQRALKQQTAPDILVRQLGAAPAHGDRTPFTFAGLALLLGYAWLLAGVDKLLLGTFPAQLTSILTGTLEGGHLPGFFSTLLQALVLPHGVLFGVLAEYAETLAGL